MTPIRLRTTSASAVVFFLLATLVAGCGELTGPESPSTPTGVTATLAGPTSATITWTPSPLNDGVISYSVFRNGTKVGESTTTSYTDTGLSPQTTYVYSIAANCKSGIVSDRSVENAASTVTTVDLTPPRVIANQPPTDFVGVSPGATVTVTFSESMDPVSINATTFTLRTASGTAIAGAVTYVATTRIATFTPASSLPNPVRLTATVTTGVRDLAGNAMAAPYTFSFTTRDDSPPTVTAVVPVDSATNVALNTTVTVTFSEAMTSASITTTTFNLRNTATSAIVPATVVYNAASNSATLTPTAPLAGNTGYTVTVTTGARDAADNRLASQFTSTFRTLNPDTTPPTVTSVVPADGEMGVATNTTVQVTFSEPMDATTINGTNITLRNTVTSAPVAATVSYNTVTRVATLTPAGPLSNATNYTFTVSTAVEDIADNPLASPVNSRFTTAPAPDATAPTIVARDPVNGATNIAVNSNATVRFSEPMAAGTINSTNITLRPTVGGGAIPATVTYNLATNTATLDPTADLANNTSYTLTVDTAVTDVIGNRVVATPAFPLTSTFTTAPDTTRPTVVLTTPTSTTGVAVTTTIVLTFSENMNSLSINGTSVTLKVTSGGAVTGSVSYDAATRRATFVPSSNLLPGTNYTVTVTTEARDSANNPLLNDFVAAFTTAP